MKLATVTARVKMRMMENDFGSTEPPKDDEFNVDGEIDINSPVLRKIIGQGSDLTLTTATASKPSGSHQPISTNTSFEMNDEDFNKLWESYYNYNYLT